LYCRGCGGILQWESFLGGLGWVLSKDWQIVKGLPKPSVGAQAVQDSSQLLVLIRAQDSTGVTWPIQDNVAGGLDLCMSLKSLCANRQTVMVA